MEIAGLIIGILGLVLAFEEPRHRIMRLFQRNSNVTAENAATSTEVKATDQVNARVETSTVEAVSPSKPAEPKADPFPGYGVLDHYEQYVLSFSTYPDGITMTETRKKFAASQESIEEALAKLESMRLVVVTRRDVDGELHWKISDVGRQFLKDNPYALYAN